MIKKLFGGTSRKSDEKEKKLKKTRMVIAKLLALNANAIINFPAEIIKKIWFSDDFRGNRS